MTSERASLFQFLCEGVFVPRWLVYLASVGIAVTGFAGLYDIVKWLS